MADMIVNDFPLCCKAKIINNFPQGDRSIMSPKWDKERVKKFVQQKMDRYWAEGKAMLVAVLTEEQTIGAEVLEELGWRSTDWMKKHNNIPGYTSTNPMKLWYCKFDEFEFVDEEVDDYF